MKRSMKHFSLIACLLSICLLTASWANELPGIALQTTSGDGIVLAGEHSGETVTYKVFCLDPGRGTPRRQKVKFTSRKGEAISESSDASKRIDPELLKRAAWIARQTDYTRQERQQAIWSLFGSDSTGSGWTTMTFIGDGASVTGITSATGGVSNAGSTTIGADTDNASSVSLSHASLATLATNITFAVGTTYLASTSLNAVSVSAVGTMSSEEAQRVNDEYREKAEKAQKRHDKLMEDSKAGAAKIDLSKVKVLVPSSVSIQRYLVEDDCP